MKEGILRGLKTMDYRLIAWTVAIELVILSLLCTTVGASYLAYEFREGMIREQEKVTAYEECIEGINSGEIQPMISLENNEITIDLDCK